MQAVIRCPHCGERFVLGELIHSHLGAWEVISDELIVEETLPGTGLFATTPPVAANGSQSKSEPSAVPGDHTVEELSLPGDPAADADNGMDVVPTEPDAHQADLEVIEEPLRAVSLNLENADGPRESSTTTRQTMDWSKLEPILPPRNERRRRRHSPLLAALPSIFGGLCSIPVAMLLIWFVLGTDPMKVAPTVARYAPWLVPAHLRGNGVNKALLQDPPQATRPIDERFRSYNEILADRLERRSNDPSRVAPASAEGAPTTDSPLLTAINEEDDAVNSRLPILLDQVQKGLDAWKHRTEDKGEQRKIASELYQGLADLAKLKLVSRSDAVETLSNAILQQTDVQELINQGARHWYSKRSSETIGIAVCCEVTDVASVDDQWVLTGKMVGRSPMPVIMKLSNNAAKPKLGVTVFALGTCEGQSSDPTVNGKMDPITIDIHHLHAQSKPNRLTQVRLPQ